MLQTKLIAEIGTDPIRSLIDDAIDQSKGELGTAADLLADLIAADAQLLEANLPSILHIWANDQIRRHWCRQRGNGQTSPAVVRIDGEVFRQAARTNTLRMMEFPLWGGKPIGHATAAEIRASAVEHAKTAATHQHRSTWQLAVAAELAKNGTSESTVKDCLTEATLNRLWEEQIGD